MKKGVKKQKIPDSLDFSTGGGGGYNYKLIGLQ